MTRDDETFQIHQAHVLNLAKTISAASSGVTQDELLVALLEGIMRPGVSLWALAMLVRECEHDPTMQRFRDLVLDIVDRQMGRPGSLRRE